MKDWKIDLIVILSDTSAKFKALLLLVSDQSRVLITIHRCKNNTFYDGGVCVAVSDGNIIYERSQFW